MHFDIDIDSGTKLISFKGLIEHLRYVDEDGNILQNGGRTRISYPVKNEVHRITARCNSKEPFRRRMGVITALNKMLQRRFGKIWITDFQPPKPGISTSYKIAAKQETSAMHENKNKMWWLEIPAHRKLTDAEVQERILEGISKRSKRAENR